MPRTRFYQECWNVLDLKTWYSPNAIFAHKLRKQICSSFGCLFWSSSILFKLPQFLECFYCVNPIQISLLALYSFWLCTEEAASSERPNSFNAERFLAKLFHRPKIHSSNSWKPVLLRCDNGMLREWFALKHWLVRITGSIHILAIYVLYILKLPAFSHFLHFESARNVLEILGLWHLTRAKSMLPLIGLLILVTIICPHYYTLQSDSSISR